MRIVVMGAGGVGGFYGARLAQGGADVTFIARGAHLQAMRQGGLRVESATAGKFTVQPVQATDDPGTLGPAELVLFCTKDYGLEAAAQSLLPVIGAQTVVLPLLNGVDAAERLGALLGAEHMIGGTVFVAASIREPGLIVHTNLDRLIFGELDGSRSPRCEAVLAALHAHGITSAELSPNIRLELWQKYLFLNAMAGVASVIRKPLGAWRAEPEPRRLYEACMQETEAVARVLGIPLPERIVADTMAFTDGRPPEIVPSMTYDLLQGRPLELEALQGTMMRLGRQTGVPTPVNDFIHAALTLWADGGG